MLVGGLGAGRGGRGGSTVPTAADAAFASSPAEEYLSDGFLAIPRATTSSNAFVMFRRMMLGIPPTPISDCSS